MVSICLLFRKEEQTGEDYQIFDFSAVPAGEGKPKKMSVWTSSRDGGGT
jgi:hypothetical protein